MTANTTRTNTHTTGGLMNVRRRLAAVMAAALSGVSLALIATAPPAAATLPAPVILNDGAQNSAGTQWAETQELPDDNGVRQFFATFLVTHAPGRHITTVRADVNFDGTDNTANNTATNVGVTDETYVGTAGSLETSRVTVPVTVGKPGGFGCPLFGTKVRSVDAPIRMRVVDNTGEPSTTTLNTTVRFIEDSNCTGSADYPRLTSASQNLTEVTPGQNITYTFSCDDVDTDFFSTDDECDRANIRWRRLDDGVTGSLPGKGPGMTDNSTQTTTANFPSQGYYVVEAQFGNENGNFDQVQAPTNGWWRLGNAIVNDAASSLSGSLGFSGVQPSSPPSVNPGGTVNATATVADTNGTVQVIEWDADNNGSFERFEYSIPTKSGNVITHAALPAAKLTQSVNTASPGLRTVNAKITDNGALDAADNIRRQLTFSGQVRVNAVPTAGNVNVTTAEDTATTVTMAGSDSDNQPAALTYSIVSPPAPATGTLGTVSGNQVTFTPAANYNGPASFTYRVDDGTGSTVGAHAASNIATVSINVTPVNDVPVVDPKSATTNEDTAVNLQATGSDIEDGATLSWTAFTQPAHGTASCNATTGLCTYTPALNFFGTDTFIVKGTDSGGASATATFTVTVNAVNDAPVPNNDTVAVPEDSVNFPINLTASDVDSVTLTFNAPVDDVDNGTLNCLGQSCTYSPNANYNGPDSFTFTVSDGALTSTGTITINVTPVNDAPVATDVLNAETDEDVPVDLTLGGTDVDSDPVTVSGVSDPPHGLASILGPNLVRYLGDLNFNGIDTFDFDVTDGQGGSDTGTVQITVHPVNDPPVINDQTFHVTEDTPTLLSMTASDVDGDALHWSVTSPAGSGVVFGGGPDVAYVPNGNFAGTDTFVVQVDDGHAATDTAVITVIVDPVNDQPMANASAVTVAEDSVANFSLDASDLDGDTLAITAPVAGPSSGGLACSGALCTYTPNPNFNGADLFTFSVDDGNGGTDNASVSITVTPVNDAPIASAASGSTDEDTTVAFNLVASDVDGDLLHYSLTSPSHGTVIGTAPNVVYVPNANYFGSDSFDFTADDTHGGQSTQTVSVTVNPVNDAPVATGGSVTTPEETAVNFQLGATDVEGDALAFTVTSPPDQGTLACNAAGACSYTPPTDYNGSAIVRYAVSDGQASDSGVFTVLVDPVNDAPVANSSLTSTQEDTALSITLSASDTEHDTLTYVIESSPAHGSLVCGSDNTSCVYTPAPNYNGSDGFSWSADDGHAGHVTATVSISVAAVNDAPQALDVSSTTDEEVPVTFPLLSNDVDGDAVTYSVASGPSHGSVTISGGNATYTPAVDFNGVDTFIFRATDPSGASTTAKATVTVVGLPLIGTYIKPDGSVAQVEVKVGVPLSARAALLRLSSRLYTSSGAPLAGRTLSFTIGTTPVCSGVTDASGFATCGTRMDGVASLLALGYHVTFAGDADYAPSAATGGIVTISVARLP
jgi:hypothetical protein